MKVIQRIFSGWMPMPQRIRHCQKNESPYPQSKAALQWPSIRFSAGKW
ncbi:hypothetical protein B4100_0602 [Heyndrickxia coagulans]|nr:hypothetical protein B4100_0602 [Heyndrickxia coagulans]